MDDLKFIIVEIDDGGATDWHCSYDRAVDYLRKADRSHHDYQDKK